MRSPGVLADALVCIVDGSDLPPGLRGSGLASLQAGQGASDVEGRLPRQLLARIGAVVHPFGPSRFSQRVVDEFRPLGPNRLHGIRCALDPLPRHGVQLADLLPQRAIGEYSIGGHQDIQMRVAWLPVNADINSHTECFREPAGEPLGQRGFLIP